MKKSLTYFVGLTAFLMVGSIIVMTSRFMTQLEHNKRVAASQGQKLS